MNIFQKVSEMFNPHGSPSPEQDQGTDKASPEPEDDANRPEHETREEREEPLKETEGKGERSAGEKDRNAEREKVTEGMKQPQGRPLRNRKPKETPYVASFILKAKPLKRKSAADAGGAGQRTRSKATPPPTSDKPEGEEMALESSQGSNITDCSMTSTPESSMELFDPTAVTGVPMSLSSFSLSMTLKTAEGDTEGTTFTLGTGTRSFRRRDRSSRQDAYGPDLQNFHPEPDVREVPEDFQDARTGQEERGGELRRSTTPETGSAKEIRGSQKSNKSQEGRGTQENTVSESGGVSEDTNWSQESTESKGIRGSQRTRSSSESTIGSPGKRQTRRSRGSESQDLGDLTSLPEGSEDKRQTRSSSRVSESGSETSKTPTTSQDRKETTRRRRGESASESLEGAEFPKEPARGSSEEKKETRRVTRASESQNAELPKESGRLTSSEKSADDFPRDVPESPEDAIRKTDVANDDTENGEFISQDQGDDLGEDQVDAGGQDAHVDIQESPVPQDSIIRSERGKGKRSPAEQPGKTVSAPEIQRVSPRLSESQQEETRGKTQSYEDMISGGRGGKRVSFRKKPKRKSERAGTIFPVGRIHRLMKERHSKKMRVSAGAAVYAAAAVEYLVAEILEISSDVAREDGRKRILPQHLHRTVKGDTEIDHLFHHVIIPEGGVQPHIHPALLPKTFLGKGKLPGIEVRKTEEKPGNAKH